MRADRDRQGFIHAMVGVLALASVAVAPISTAHALDDQKGDAKVGQVLDRMIEASGGKALDKVKNRVSTGTIDFKSLGVTGTITLTQAAPNKSRAVSDMKGIGKSEQGCDGKLAWETSDMQGARLIEGEEREVILRQTAMTFDSDWRKYYNKYELQGEETVADKSCHKLVLTPTVGKDETWFVDQKTYLPVRTIMTIKTPMGEITVQSDFDEYKSVDGVQMPRKLTQTVMSMEIVTTLDKIEHNADLPKDAFDAPAAVKALPAGGAEPAGDTSGTKPASTDKPASGDKPKGDKPADEKP